MIDIEFTDRIAYYNTFDEYNEKHKISAMEKLFAGYVNARLDKHLKNLQDQKKRASAEPPMGIDEGSFSIDAVIAAGFSSTSSSAALRHFLI